jgi:amidophosphoribosyltransferase
MLKIIFIIIGTGLAFGVGSGYTRRMCGIFGIFGHEEAANLAYLGLHALQHRGQESAGIASTDGRGLFAHRALGLVQEVFQQSVLAKLPGNAAIGHVRYSTAGGSGLKNAQPLAVDFSLGSLAVAHNGNLTNAEGLRHELEGRGSIFQSSADTETIVHLIAISRRETLKERVIEALERVEGAYSLLFLMADRMIAARDPLGVRPLCLGKHRQSGALVVASESVAFDLIDAELVREVMPGELLVIDKDGLHSEFPFRKEPRHDCIFEHVYFSRPDTRLGKGTVYEVRRRCGEVLAREIPVDADVVVAVPDSGIPAAIGFARAAKIPFEIGLTRSHYVGRTFIEPQQSIRHFGVRLKLNPVRSTLEGQRVIVIDDSIVRGTTSRKIVKMLRDAGAREVHVRISSPPTRWPCYYGIDTPTRGELIASSHTPEQIARYLTADSLGYLSLEGLQAAVAEVTAQEDPTGFCHACFSGNYPIPFAPPPSNRQLRLIQ